MSQRVAKVESLIQQVVASGLLVHLDRPVAATVTVTRVDASPDLRHAIVWLGILGDEAAREAAYKRILFVQRDIQVDLAKRVATKFAPRLSFKLDTGGEYAAHIDSLLHGL